MKEKASSPIYIPQFDSIRFFAAFLIIIYHSYISWKGWFGIPGIISTGDYRTFSSFGLHVDQLIRNMTIGVDIFFFISGYLLTYILVIEKNKFGKVSIVKFYLRRGLRIWPLYYFLIAITPLIISWLGVEKPTYLPTIALVNNFETIQTQQWIYPFAHFWSICIEEHFYLFWPVIVALIPVKKLPTAILYLFCFSWGFKIYTYLFLESNWYSLYLHTISRMDVILLGGLLAVLYLKKPFEFKLPGLVIVVISAIVIILLSFDDMSFVDNMFNGVARRAVYISLIGLLIMDLLFNPDRQGFMKSFKPLLYLGKVSYGIYMYGNIIVLIVIRKVLPLFGPVNIYYYVLVVFSLSLIVPIISYELFEKPFLKLKQRFALVKTRL